MLSHIIPAALLLGQLPLAAFAHPITRRSTAMPQWTLRGFHWNCSPSQDLCIYGFSLAEEPAAGEVVEAPSFCHFAIRAKTDEETAYKAGFADIPCDNLTMYRVASTFGDNGYMVLSIDNIEKQRRAYFNFNIAELESSEMAPVQQSVAYAVTQSSSPDYTDDSYEDATDDYELAPTIPGALAGDSDGSNEASASDDASVLENLAAQGNDDTPDDADSYGDDNDYNDYTDGPTIELADVDVTEAGTNDYSDSSDASIIATVAARAVGTTCADENDRDEIVFEAAYTAETPRYDDESYDNTDEAAETLETVDVPALAVVADATDYSTDADDDYADDDDQADESLIVSPDDAIVAAVSATSDATYSESDDGDSYNDADGYDASTILTVPTMPEFWTMRNISRSIEYDPNAVVMQFTIDVLPDGPKSIPCSLRVDLDKNIDPMFGSWFVQQCQESGWYLSWGYNQMTESAVVTLINSERTKRAWFGWNSVNARYPDVTLNSVGPSIVQNNRT